MVGDTFQHFGNQHFSFTVILKKYKAILFHNFLSVYFVGPANYQLKSRVQSGSYLYLGSTRAVHYRYQPIINQK